MPVVLLDDLRVAKMADLLGLKTVEMMVDQKAVKLVV